MASSKLQPYAEINKLRRGFRMGWGKSMWWTQPQNLDVALNGSMVYKETCQRKGGEYKTSYNIKYINMHNINET